jgi:hypothetical protein
VLKNKHQAVSQGNSAQGSKLKGKDPIRSAFSFELPADSCLYVSIYKSRTTPDHGLRRSFSTLC